jgi:SulP family sulfate permease
MGDSHASNGDSSNEGPEVNQPGLGDLREAIANDLGSALPGRAAFQKDAVAGLNTAVSSVPDGLASGILAGVNPVFGLYAAMAGPIAGGIFASTQLMVIITTSASALAAGQALAGISVNDRDNALFLMVFLIGALQVLFGLLRLGRLTRFVSYSVMTGFIIGIAVVTVLSQLPTVAGYDPEGGNRVTETVNLLGNAGKIDVPSLAAGILGLGLVIVLPRTRLGNFGTLVAIIIPSLLLVLIQSESVQLVRDVGSIPSGVPTPAAPSFSEVNFDVLTGALAVAVIILVQGAGVSQSVPNPDGSRRRMSRDFVAQGAANIASGLFRGLPVGGSLGSTALSVISGARTRWAAIFAGLWMALIVIVFPGAVAYIAMPVLGALLMYASASTIKRQDIAAVWNAGWPLRLIALTTFLATLTLPIQAAVGLGVVFSALFYLYQSSSDVSIVALVERPDGRIEERRPPEHLPSNDVTVLDVYGNLFYAGARTLERLLPEPHDARNPVVVLRLRGHPSLGATLVEVLSSYADKLNDADGRLYLSGISQQAYDQVVASGKLRLTGPVRAYEATSIVGESTREASADARDWLRRVIPEDSRSQDPPSDRPPEHTARNGREA